MRSINDPEYTEVVDDIDIGESSSNDPIYLPMLANTFHLKDAIHFLYPSHVLADLLSISLHSRRMRIRGVFFNGVGSEVRNCPNAVGDRQQERIYKKCTVF